jgi:hypothetical protein
MAEVKSDESIAGGEYCRVHFRVRCETVMGQTVALGGSTHQLGYFDKDKVVTLVTSPESYPVWYTLNPIVLPRHQLVHYKFCVMEAGSVRAFEVFIKICIEIQMFLYISLCEIYICICIYI